MKKTAHIIYVNYLKPDGSEMSIGGIQTYIRSLTGLLSGMGYCVNIYQKSKIGFHKQIGEANVLGYIVKSARPDIIGKILFKKCRKHFDTKSDILIFGCDNYITDTNGIPFIAIQHGITWDKPEARNKIYWMFKKFYRGWLTVNRVEKATLLVCVDNNFINWYRATVAYPRVKCVVIPNFSEISPIITKPDDGVIRIIFARRYFDYRGTRIFTNAIRRILDAFHDVEVTFAGSGPDEQWIKKTLTNFNQVKFIRYTSDSALIIHQDKDIAVVPSLGSEGSSLSLIEAMSCQCAVVCTNVGGMTDIVINNFNGVMVNPDEDSLYLSLKKLIEDKNFRIKLSQNAYSIVQDSLSKGIWLSRWESVLENYISNRSNSQL